MPFPELAFEDCGPGRTFVDSRAGNEDERYGADDDGWGH